MARTKTTTRKTTETAAQAFERNDNDCMTLVDLLLDALDVRRGDVKAAGGADWGDVGDFAQVRGLLSQAVAFLENIESEDVDEAIEMAR